MRTNLWDQFLDLIPRRRRLVGTVTAHHPDGTSSFQLPGSQSVVVRGQLDATPPYRAWVVDGAVESAAPNLTVVSTEA
jgi:hypothetical protein